MRFAVLLLVALAPPGVVACGSGSPPPGPQATSSSSLAGAGDPSLPVAVHALEGAPKDAPLVATKARAISVDGAKVADAPVATASAKKPARIDGLFRALQARGQEWKKAHPNEPGRAAFTFEADETASVVKSVVFTAAQAGHPYAAFLTRVAPPNGGLVPGYLNADVRLEDPPKGERELHVNLSSRGVVLLKWKENERMLGDIVPGDVQVAKLATLIERGWNERGVHREPADRRFDQAYLHVENDTPYTLLVITLDALHATKRKLAVAGKEELVPAINVNLMGD